LGAHFFSIDSNLLDLLASSGQFGNFVETGTFNGDTALLAASRFSKVWTVESSKSLYAELIHKFKNVTNVTWECAESPAWLRQFRTRALDGGTVYWLDAHWCGSEGTDSDKAQCPLLDELDAIGSLNSNDLILIDDARLYSAKPPPPHISSDWPKFSEVLHGIRRLSREHEIRIVNDIIIAFDPSLVKVIDAYSDAHGANLIDLVWKANEYDKMRDTYRQRSRTLSGRLRRHIKRLFRI